MEFKGTKGKWEVSKYNPHGRVQVNLGDLKGHLDIWYHNGHSMTREEAEANALLISKSLELLRNSMMHIDALDLSPIEFYNKWGFNVSELIPKTIQLIKEAT